MKAFTLVEMVLYLALLSLLMLGSVSLAYSVSSRSESDAEILRTLEEGTFVLQKVAWAVGQSRAIQITSSGVLMHNDAEGADPIRIEYASGILSMSESGALPAVIATDVESLSFETTDGALLTEITIRGRTFSSVLDLPYD